MDSIRYFFSNLLNTDDWPARWFCGKWTEFHGWLYIFSDLMIWGAYFAIPLCIVYYITKKSGNLRFQPIFWLFFSFILACGLTHLVDAMMFWWPAYRVNALLRMITAIVSWATVFTLIRVIPIAQKLKTEKELEQTVEHRTTELFKTNISLRATAEQLQQKNHQLEEFANIASHNLRTPVANLQALLQLYDVVETQEEKAEMIDRIKTESLKMNDTLNHLIDAVKIKQDVAIKKEELSFENTFLGIRESMHGLIMEAEASVEHDFSALQEISYPREYLESIMMNLLSNAIKYRSRERKAEIHFRTGLINGKKVLVARDNGLGIDLKKYGGKLFNLNKTFHGNPDAKGIGLYLTKTQINAMGGSISATSEPGKGTEFTIIF